MDKGQYHEWTGEDLSKIRDQLNEGDIYTNQEQSNVDENEWYIVVWHMWCETYFMQRFYSFYFCF